MRSRDVAEVLRHQNDMNFLFTEQSKRRETREMELYSALFLLALFGEFSPVYTTVF